VSSPDVNHGGTHHNSCTQRLVISRAPKQNQSDLHLQVKIACQKIGHQ